MPECFIYPDFFPVLKNIIKRNKTALPQHRRGIKQNFPKKETYKHCRTLTVKQVVNLCCFIDQIMKTTDAAKRLYHIKKYLQTKKYWRHVDIRQTHFVLILTSCTCRQTNREITVNMLLGLNEHIVFQKKNSPRTVNMRVFVKCLYKESLTRFLLNLSVLVVWTRLVKTAFS